MANEKKEPSFWDRLFSSRLHSDREEKVAEYIIYRLRQGAGLQEITQEEYVRRNATPEEVNEILCQPRLVGSAHKHLKHDFSSGDLDPGRKPA